MGQGESQAVTSAHRASPQQGGKGAAGRGTSGSGHCAMWPVGVRSTSVGPDYARVGDRRRLWGESQWLQFQAV